MPTMDTTKDNEGFTLVQSRKSRKRKLPMETEAEQVSKGEEIVYPPAKQERLQTSREVRRIAIPQHRYAPLKANWLKIMSPVVEYLHLQIRFNLHTRNVEIKTCKETQEVGALQKAADFIRAFSLGFEVDDALALVRLDDLFLESFEIQDVKPLKGDHLARCIGRIAGKGGRTKFTIENVTKTRIVLADSKIHILGSYQNIRAARTAICSLILGKPPSKVYGKMRQLANRIGERF
uniref:Putative RNA-binding protein Pno1p n=1 Tax=Ornithodoros parkeri TaxID=140564 RepID=A6NA16_ORNPR|nr:putative RNA-binding protein Pno1p [Ornithodoros parkeri]